MNRQVTGQPLASAPGSWEEARAGLSGLPGGSGLNIAYEAVDRHNTGPFASRVALRCLAESGAPHELTYSELAERSSRFASVLASLGIGRGERVFVLTGRIPELYISVLGGLKFGAVVCTLFAAFGPDPIAQRLRLGDGRVLVTTRATSNRPRYRSCPGRPPLQVRFPWRNRHQAQLCRRARCNHRPQCRRCSASSPNDCTSIRRPGRCRGCLGWGCLGGHAGLRSLWTHRVRSSTGSSCPSSA
jgi:hypothetical protein